MAAFKPFSHFATHCAEARISNLSLTKKNETLFYKLEISRHFLCDFATHLQVIAKSRRFAGLSRSTFNPIRASCTE